MVQDFSWIVIAAIGGLVIILVCIAICLIVHNKKKGNFVEDTIDHASPNLQPVYSMSVQPTPKPLSISTSVKSDEDNEITTLQTSKTSGNILQDEFVVEDESDNQVHETQGNDSNVNSTTKGEGDVIDSCEEVSVTRR